MLDAACVLSIFRPEGISTPTATLSAGLPARRRFEAEIGMTGQKKY